MGAADTATPAEVGLAEAFGGLVAQRGWVVLTGGRDVGVMSAAARGAKRVSGSLVIGILPGPSGPVSPHVDVAVFTGLGNARNAINVLSSDVVVACGVSASGTASEAALALKSGKPLVLLAPTPEAQAFFMAIDSTVMIAATPEQALEHVEASLKKRVNAATA